MITPIHHRHSIRIPHFDYSQEGWYFATVCTKDRINHFGDIENGEMKLNQIGEIVKKEWLQTPIIRSNVSLDQYTVMPNHVHGLIIIERKVDVGRVGAYCNTPLQSPSQTIGSIVRGFKSAVTKRINALFGQNHFFWQRNYYEHVIHNGQSLKRIREYNQNNPLQWELDVENPRCLKRDKKYDKKVFDNEYYDI